MEGGGLVVVAVALGHHAPGADVGDDALGGAALGGYLPGYLLIGAVVGFREAFEVSLLLAVEDREAVAVILYAEPLAQGQGEGDGADDCKVFICALVVVSGCHFFVVLGV